MNDIQIIEEDGIEIIDNFLPKEEFEKLYSSITHERFPWVMGPVVRDDTSSVPKKYNWQIAHLFYHSPDVISHETMPILGDVYSKLNIGVLIKAKANCNIVTNEIIEHGLHIDVEQIANICTTAILYLNTNNGYTVFEDGTKVESIENRLVKFPASIKHSGTSCTDIHNRMVINFNYIELKEEYARH